MSRAMPATLVALLLLASCGTESAPAPAPHSLPSASERVPITQRAIAAIALAHLEGDTSDRREMETDRHHPKGLVGADLRYHASPGEDGDLLRVALAPGKPKTDPCKYSECVDLETDVNGATLLLHWQEEVPDQGPGAVSVLLQRDGEYAYVYVEGPAVTGDPRELDLTVGVDEMTDVVEDAWLRLATSPEAVAAGDEVEDWESDDLEFGVDDPVANTDLGLLAAYLDFQDSGVPYDDHRASPLTAELGPDAIGGRMTVPPDNGYILGDEQLEFDILAAPDPAAWFGGDPCARRVFTGHCHRYPGAQGPVYLAWRPAANGDPGLVWVGSVREDEVVAIRIRGFGVPHKRLDVESTLGLFTFQDQFDNNERLGTTTDQEVLDAASEL